MFAMAKIPVGSTYLANRLSVNDYHAEGERARCQCVGNGDAQCPRRGRQAACGVEAKMCRSRFTLLCAKNTLLYRFRYGLVMNQPIWRNVTGPDVSLVPGDQPRHWPLQNTREKGV